MLGDDADRLKSSRDDILQAMGPAALVDAAGIAGFFNGIVRVADSTGTPLDEETAEDTVELRARLGIDRFAETKHQLSDQKA